MLYFLLWVLGKRLISSIEACFYRSLKPISNLAYLGILFMSNLLLDPAQFWRCNIRV